MLVAIFIYIISSKTANLESRLVKFAKLVTLIQLVIIIIQLFAPSAFDLLWPSIKTRGIEGILRVTGSMYNPNRFAFFMTFLSVLIFARTGPIANWFWVLLIYTMLILSGSRTIMLGFPLLLSVWFLFYSSGHYLRKMVFWGISLLMLLPAMLFIIYLFKDNLRYAAHLFNIIESGSLLSVNSLAKRIEIWDAALHLWTPGSILNFLFGAGARGELGTVDNDFLFVLTRNGLAGFFLHIMMYLSLLWIGLQKRNTYEGRVLFLIVLATMGWGITSETLATMTIGIYVAITVGLALGRGNERMARHSRQDHRVKL
ncbi:MAG: hypothetical protein K9J79_10575 [Desulfobacteraceae bacterium]|nr:hypothetical protein [Desulfobacteraceae bacterium]